MPAAGEAGTDLERVLTGLIRDVDDYPLPGVVFKDITPVLADAAAFSMVIDAFAGQLVDQRVDKIVGIEARGFILGAAIAYRLNAGFVPVRKAGKLPHETWAADYQLEYASASIEVHRDAFSAGDRVVIVDDVLATGGTASACVELVRRGGAEVVAVMVLLELGFLDGRARLGDVDVRALMQT